MKIIRHEDDINFQSHGDTDGFFNGSSYPPYVIVDLNVLIEKARYHECGSKISFGLQLDQYQGIGAHLKVFFGSTKSTFAKFLQYKKTRMLLYH